MAWRLIDALVLLESLDRKKNQEASLTLTN